MNDGKEWKELRSWTVRALRGVGFAKEPMTQLLIDELTLILEKLKDGGVQKIRPVISPAVINVLWMLLTGRKPSENLSRYANSTRGNFRGFILLFTGMLEEGNRPRTSYRFRDCLQIAEFYKSAGASRATLRYDRRDSV